MSNFNLSDPTLKIWTATRKSKRQLGSNFVHPRIFSTVDFKADSNWFWFAVFIESLTLLIAVTFAGFSLGIIVGAVFAVLMDFVAAIQLHKGETHINRFNRKLELSIYESNMEFIDPAVHNDQKEVCTRSIENWKRHRIPWIVLIIFIAFAKVVFGFLALIPYGIVSFIIPLFFFICAYIHIKHTGFYFAEKKFQKQFKKEEAIFLAEVAAGTTKGSPYAVQMANLVAFSNIPENLHEALKTKLESLSDQEKNKRRINAMHDADFGSSIIEIYGVSQALKIIYDGTRDKFFLSAKGSIKDDDLFELIEKGGIESEDLKSYIGYIGLSAQKVEEPDPRLKNR